MGPVACRRSSVCAALLATGVFAAFGAACGARSALREEVGASGDGACVGGASSVSGSGGGATSTGSAAGGGGATATSGPSTTTGAGGALPGDCVLAAVAPEVSLLDGAGHVTLGTRLAFSSDDRERVSVIYGKDPTPEYALLRHTAFSPWDAWPATGTIPGGFDVQLSTNGAFVAASLPGDGLGVVGVQGVVSFVGGAPDAALTGATTVYGGSGEGVALSLDRGVVDDLVAFQFPIGPNLAGLAVGRVGLMGTAPYYTGPKIIGCANPTVAAAALPNPGGWLLVSGTSQVLGPCDLDLAGPPTTLAVTQLDLDGEVVAPLDALALGASVRTVAVTPRTDGAWVAWIHEGATSEVSAVRIDALGHFVGTPFTASAGLEPASEGLFAATPLGERLLLVWGLGSGAVAVRLVGDDGQTISQAILPTSGTLFHAVSVLGSPAGDAAVVAYTQGGLNGKSTSRLVKLVCGPTGSP